jgi:uncharacterized protein
MHVGVCRLSLYLPGNDSLKGKRSIVRKILERSKNRFNVAIAEVGDNDRHRHAVIGFCVLGNDPSHVHSMISKVLSFIGQTGIAVPMDQRIEVISMGDDFGMEREILSIPEDFDLFEVE